MSAEEHDWGTARKRVVPRLEGETDLEWFLRISGLSEVWVMDLLRKRGLVTDPQARAVDVMEPGRAVEWLMGRPMSQVVRWWESGF